MDNKLREQQDSATSTIQWQDLRLPADLVEKTENIRVQSAVCLLLSYQRQATLKCSSAVLMRMDIERVKRKLEELNLSTADMEVVLIVLDHMNSVAFL